MIEGAAEAGTPEREPVRIAMRLSERVLDVSERYISCLTISAADFIKSRSFKGRAGTEVGGSAIADQNVEVCKRSTGKGRYGMTSKRSGSKARSGASAKAGKRMARKEQFRDLEAKGGEKIRGGGEVTHTRPGNLKPGKLT